MKSDENDSDRENYNSNKKLLDGSDFDMKIPTAGGNFKGSKMKDQDILEGDDAGTELYGDAISQMETLEEFVGPVKDEFYRLKRLIDEKDEELKTLEDDFYQRVSSKSVELEGIGPEQEAEIDRHRHLFEMKRLMELN